MDTPKKIYRQHELPIADYLETFREGLLNDFMAGYNTIEEISHTDFLNATLDNGREDIPKEMLEYMIRTEKQSNPQAWLATCFKYHNPERDHLMIKEDQEYKDRYPTAYKMLAELNDDCPIMNYSVIAPQSKINRHNGIENISGKYIRIHIPLIIPKGEVFLEVAGEKVYWREGIFGFNNQWIHSAHNRTDEWRLIFLVDVDRERAGLTPGIPYRENLYKVTEDFEEPDPGLTHSWSDFAYKEKY